MLDSMHYLSDGGVRRMENLARANGWGEIVDDCTTERQLRLL